MDNNIFNTINRIMNSPTMQSIQRTHDKIAKMTQPVQDMQKVFETINVNLVNSSIFKTIPQMQNQFKTIFDSPSFKNIHNTLEQNQVIFQNIFTQFDFDALYKKLEEDEKNQIYVEQYEQQITEEELKEFNKIILTLGKIFPEFKTFIESIENKEYKSGIVAVVIFIIFRILPLLMVYNNYFENDAYMVNRENVRLRTSPISTSNDNIVKKLHRNEYVVKIDEENGWIKVNYDLEDGQQIEGWIYRTLLSKVE